MVNAFSVKKILAEAGNTTLEGVGNFKGFVAVAINLFNQLAILLIGLAVFVVIYGIFRYIREADDPEKRTEGMRFVAYGILGVFIMISFWGLVSIIRNTFILPNSGGSYGSGQSSQETRSQTIDNCVAGGKERALCELDYDGPGQPEVPPSSNSIDIPGA